jgi:glycerophosphoryl diester phosphodiesterase
MNENKSQPLIIGHRGAYDEAPENTLKGFKRAIELGADYIEFDVHQSQDGALVVIHGNDILRRMGYNNSIDQMTLKELQKLDLGEGEKVPELWEVLKLAKGKINLVCEIKEKGISDKLLTLFRDEDVLDSTIIQSFYVDVLLAVRKLEPELELAAIVPITEEYIPGWQKRKNLIEKVIDLDFPILETRHKNVDEEFLHYAHKHNIKVFAYTITTKKIMERMVKMGVDGIIVNSISKAKIILEQIN